MIGRQADAAYQLGLDFFRLAIWGDFPRWLSQHSGINRETCRRRNQSGLLSEQRETTPVPELAWDEA